LPAKVRQHVLCEGCLAFRSGVSVCHRNTPFLCHMGGFLQSHTTTSIDFVGYPPYPKVTF
jgi:hypothetical protein